MPLMSSGLLPAFSGPQTRFCRTANQSNRFNISINQQADRVQFGRKVSLKGFQPEDVRFIEQETRKYRYGKDMQRLLAPESGLKAYVYHGNVFLRNFDYLNTGYQGICYELADDLMAKLQDRFKDKYCFLAVEGKSPRFFHGPRANHSFVLGCTPQNKQKVLSDIQHHPGQIPEDALVIDPSFGVTDGGLGRQGYVVKKVVDNQHILNNDNFTVYQAIIFDADTKKVSTPLGFLSELTGKRPVPGKEEPLVYLRLEKNPEGGNPFVFVSLQTADAEKPTVWQDWEKKVAADCPLARFMHKLKEDFATPDNTMREMDKAYPHLNLRNLDPIAGSLIVVDNS